MSRKSAPKGLVVNELARSALGKIRKAGQSGINPKQLALQMGLKDKAQRMLLYEALDQLVLEGRAKRGKKGRLKATKKDGLLTGTIEFISNGNAFLRPSNGSKDVFIPRNNTSNAFHGDLVKVRVKTRKGDARPEGKVMEVLERKRSSIVGTIGRQRNVFYLEPDDKRIPDYFAIKLAKNEDHPPVGSKAVASIVHAGDARTAPTCSIDRILGEAGVHEVEMNAIMWEFGLPDEFPAEVEAEAAKIANGATKEEISRRRDMRNVVTLTIDPHDAKDLDDALSIVPLENGNYEIGVHIADVSHYVRPGSEIEKEAKARATSVYLVDRVIPMLPEKLSNDLCSLNPETDKLSYSAVFEMDAAGKVAKRWFGRTVIHSNKRFSYEEAQKLIDGESAEYGDEVRTLHQISERLRAKRLKSGALEIVSKEVKFHLNEKGEPTGVYEKIMKPANWLIEEFMLLANREVAKKGGYDKGKERSFVYRIHDKPDESRIDELKQLIRSFGHKVTVNKGETINHGMNRLLKEIEGSDEAPIIQQLLIRSMSKAVYSTNNIGHYGLSFSHYSHFTSPIRRYPDLMVHRALEHYLKGGAPLNSEELELSCKHSSEREKNAAQAERASIRYKQVEYLSSRVNQEFDGTINSVTKWGIFITLNENYCEGMVPLREIPGDNYFFDADKFEIRGRRNGRVFRIGDEVRVEITEVDMQRREVTLAFV